MLADCQTRGWPEPLRLYASIYALGTFNFTMLAGYQRRPESRPAGSIAYQAELGLDSRLAR